MGFLTTSRTVLSRTKCPRGCRCTSLQLTTNYLQKSPSSWPLSVRHKTQFSNPSVCTQEPNLNLELRRQDLMVLSRPATSTMDLTMGMISRSIQKSSIVPSTQITKSNSGVPSAAPSTAVSARQLCSRPTKIECSQRFATTCKSSLSISKSCT